MQHLPSLKSHGGVLTELDGTSVGQMRHHASYVHHADMASCLGSLAARYIGIESCSTFLPLTLTLTTLLPERTGSLNPSMQCRVIAINVLAHPTPSSDCPLCMHGCRRGSCSSMSTLYQNSFGVSCRLTWHRAKQYTQQPQRILLWPHVLHEGTLVQINCSWQHQTWFDTPAHALLEKPPSLSAVHMSTQH